MKEQLNLFEGNKLRDLGIEQSFENAGEKWGSLAYSFLLQYIKKKR